MRSVSQRESADNDNRTRRTRQTQVARLGLLASGKAAIGGLEAADGRHHVREAILHGWKAVSDVDMT